MRARHASPSNTWQHPSLLSLEISCTLSAAHCEQHCFGSCRGHPPLYGFLHAGKLLTAPLRALLVYSCIACMRVKDDLSKEGQGPEGTGVICLITQVCNCLNIPFSKCPAETSKRTAVDTVLCAWQPCYSASWLIQSGSSVASVSKQYVAFIDHYNFCCHKLHGTGLVPSRPNRGFTSGVTRCFRPAETSQQVPCNRQGSRINALGL
jgi:hypothetical protein